MRRAAAVLTVLALTAPVASRAQQAGAEQTAVRAITVIGTGTIRRTPDVAVVSLAVETMAANARAAAQDNATRMDSVIRALRQAGTPAERIRTTSYSLNPEYQYTQATPTKPGEQRLVGYRASNTVEVRVDSIPRVGLVLDAAVAAGANRALGISYQLRDPDAARREALRAAVANARADAQALAEAAGQRLGTLLELSTSGFVRPPTPMFEARKVMDMAAQAPTPVEPGELEVTATVTAVYRIAGPGGESR